MTVLHKALTAMALALTTAVLVSACKTADAGEVDLKALQENKFRREAVEKGDAILKNYKAGDYKGIMALLPKDAGKTYSKADFELSRKQITAQLGEIEKWEYITMLDAPMLKTHLWRVTFYKIGLDNGEYRNDVLMRMVTGTLDGKLYVAGFGFK